ncbi:MAG: hypothetical protein IKW80_11525, partial [Thermoguttaceae bacterium]|nr:hypothetical protein [Thermoguttaceae bacterium]
MKNAYRFFVALLVLTMSSLAYADPNNPYQVSEAYSADNIVPYMSTDTTVQVLSTPSGAVSLYTDQAASNVPANSEGLIIGGAGNYPSIYANTEDFRNLKQIRVLSDGYLYVPNAGTDSYYSNLSVEGGSVLIEKNYINVRSAQMSVSDGSLTLNRLRIGYDSGTTGKSTFTQTGGYVTINTVEGDNPYLLVGYKTGSEGELNISGGSFNSNLETKVGDSGTGTFNLSGGDFYQNAGWLNLGYESSGIGYMNVTGGNFSYLTNDFRVGRKGIGELTLESGTINLGEKNLVMGYYEGSEGTFTMTGGTLSINGLVLGEKVATETKPGAKGTANFIGVDVTIPGDSSIGSYGSGFLNLDGARLTVNPGYLYIANHTGSTAEVNMTNGAYLTQPGHALRVGTSGTAVVNVLSGSTLENSDTNDIHIGYNANGNGTVNADNSYVNSRNIVVGNAGTGALNLTNNASSTVGNLYVGGNEDNNKYTGTGTVTLSNGATLTATSNIDIGNYGTGTLTVENSTINCDGKLYIGNHGDGGANGTVNFNSGSNINITGNIVVGKSGTGTLNVDTINLNIANYLCVGGEVDNTTSTGVGTVNLTNGAVLNVAAHTMRIGHGGTGTVNVLSNSTIESSSYDLYMGYNDTGNGTLNIDGGTVNSKKAIIANNGTGTLNLKSGELNTGTTHVYVGNGAGSNGTFNMTGGHLTTGDLRVGENGTGVANITGGTIDMTYIMYAGIYNGSNGTINLTGSDVNINVPGNILIGYDAGSTGKIVVDGATLTGNSELRVGRHGDATMTIKNNANVTNTGIVYVGQYADSTGVLNVEGGTFTANGEIRIADLGKGTMNITGGSATIAGLVNVGYAKDETTGKLSTGKVSIKNGTLTLTNAGNTFRIGRYGEGTVEVLEGGQLIVENNTTQLGYYAGGNGTLTIDGGYAKLKRLEIGYAADSTGTFEMKGGKLDILAVDNG